MKLIVIGTGSTGNGYILDDGRGSILFIEAGLPSGRYFDAIGYRTGEVAVAV